MNLTYFFSDVITENEGENITFKYNLMCKGSDLLVSEEFIFDIDTIDNTVYCYSTDSTFKRTAPKNFDTVEDAELFVMTQLIPNHRKTINRYN